MSEWLLRLPEWVCRLLQPGEDNRRWRELCRTARVNRLRREARANAFWSEWNALNTPGRDAYFRGDFAEADLAFEALIAVKERLFHEDPGLAMTYVLANFPPTVDESARWWQRGILMDGTFRWNTWRRANSDVVPDLRFQDLQRRASLNAADLSRADLRSVNFSGNDFTNSDFRDSDLTGASLYECTLRDADLRGANLTAASLANADAGDANLSGANLSQASLECAELYGANLTDATGLTEAQLALAFGDSRTILPERFKRPSAWSATR
jgi:uncharacterized protein YjbI with pentapeptide repeats